MRGGVVVSWFSDFFAESCVAPNTSTPPALDLHGTFWRPGLVQIRFPSRRAVEKEMGRSCFAIAKLKLRGRGVIRLLFLVLRPPQEVSVKFILS